MADIQGHDAVGGAMQKGKPDPNVQLPSAVKRASERADELAKQAREAKAANPNADAPVNIAPPSAPPQASGVTITDFDPNKPNPSIEPNSSGSPAPPNGVSSPAAPVELSDWEHQFKSLKGRYDREAENSKRMARQIADMQQLMAQVAPPAQPQGSGVKFDNVVAGRYVTPKEVEEYGQELIDVVGRRAREITEPVVAQLTNELNALRRQVGGVTNSQAYDASVRMYDHLAQEVPNWDAINNSGEFSRWLDQPDPMTGVIRRHILNYAHGRNQANQVVAVFKGFLADQASYGPANGGTAPGNGAGGYSASNVPASSPQVDLAQFAAPGRAKSGQTQVPPEKPFFNAADITQLYRDKTAGRYTGREAEFAQLEAAIIEASKEGRVRR